MSLVRSALAANVGFSAASGLVLSVAPGAVGGAVGADVDSLLRLFGIALLVHAVLLAAAVRHDEVRRWATINLAAIAPYPIAMVAAAVTVADSAAGVALVLGDGAAIGLIAAATAIGLRADGDTSGRDTSGRNATEPGAPAPA